MILPLILGLAAQASGYLVQHALQNPVRVAAASSSRAAVVRLEAPAAAAGLGGVQQIKADETYDMMFEALLKTNESIKSQISANYAMIDYGFLQRLDQQIADNKPENAERLRRGQGGGQQRDGDADAGGGGGAARGADVADACDHGG